MKPDDHIRLMHMAKALGHAIRFVEGRSRADLDSDQMLTFARLYALQTSGEAANNVGPATRQQLPQIPWSVIVGMRDRLVHAYAGIDHDIPWTTATEAAPKLLEQVNRSGAASTSGYWWIPDRRYAPSGMTNSPPVAAHGQAMTRETPPVSRLPRQWV